MYNKIKKRGTYTTLEGYVKHFTGLSTKVLTNPIIKPFIRNIDEAVELIKNCKGNYNA